MSILSLTNCYLESLDKLSPHLEADELLMNRTTSTQSLSQPAVSQVAISHHTRLPRIELPKFNGTPSEWLSFKDLFSSIIIKNTSLSAVEKLQYLKASLTGTAAHLLKNTALTENNFQKAWEDLISFYENKRLLVNASIQALLSLKRMTSESATDLERLYTNLMQIFRTLETLERPVDKWDDFLVFVAVQRLDSESVKAWEQHLGSAKNPPTWKQFCEFLVTRLLTLQAFEKSRGVKPGMKVHQHAMKTHFQTKPKADPQSPTTCVICSSDHYLWGCPKYISQTAQQRYALISKHGRCFNCLGAHRVSDCRSTKRCTKCGRRHHTTIHRQSVSNKENRPVSTGTTKPSDIITTSAQTLHAATTSGYTSSCILLATAQVVINNCKSGRSLKVRALIDQGSEVTLLSERVVQTLRLPRTTSTIPLVGVGGHSPNKTHGYTSFKVTSIHENMEEFELSAHILPKITSSIPSVPIHSTHWPHLEELTLADPNFFQPRPVDLLIGADVYSRIIKEGMKKGPDDAPIAQLTAFGWILSGPTTLRRRTQPSHSYHVAMEPQLYNLISKFWLLEEVPTVQATLQSPEYQECEDHFQNTHSRDSNGKYVVCLPFKKSTHLLGNSRHKASRMLISLWNKFRTDVEYAQTYVNFMSEYEDLDHMKLVAENQPEPQPNYYLPHHGVQNAHSTTTKLRVVFNGSSSTTSKISLNDILHTGPKLQLDLLDVLIRFRQFRYVFSADIQRMYRQIKVHPQDWRFQRILWSQSAEHIKTYELTTVTYGLACAPYLALRTMAQLVEDEKHNFPLAVPCLTKGRYVDDVFGGSDSIEMATV